MRILAFVAGVGMLSGLLFYVVSLTVFPMLNLFQVGVVSFILCILTLYIYVWKLSSGYLDFAMVGTPAREKLFSIPRNPQVTTLSIAGKRYSFFELDPSSKDDQDRSDVEAVLKYLLTHHDVTLLYGPKSFENDSPDMVYRLAVGHKGKRCDVKQVFPGRVRETTLAAYSQGLNPQANEIFFGKKQASGDPGIVVLGNQVLQPLVVDRFLIANPLLIETLKAMLGSQVRVILHANASPVGKKAAAQIHVISTLESMIPNAILQEGKEEMDQKAELARNLDHHVLLQTVLWLRYPQGAFEASILKKRVQVFLDGKWETVSLPPFQSLNNLTAFLPWLRAGMVNSKTGSGTTLERASAIKVLTQYQRWGGTQSGTQFLIPGTEPEYTVRFQPFASGENYNILVAGTSGSGKSVLLGQMVYDHLKEDFANDAMVIEFGGSFSNLTRILGGRFIDKGSDFKLSPFPSLEANPQELGSLLETSFGLISNFLLESTPPKRLAPTMLELFIDAYRQVVETCETVQDLLKAMVDLLKSRSLDEEIYRESQQPLIDALISLKAVIRQQSFLGDAGDTSSRLAVFDLEGFGENELRSLVGLIRLMIQEKMVRQNRQGRTLIVYDEAHYYIRASDKKLNILGQLIQQDLRVSRKHGTAILIATQSVKDYEGSVIAENCSHHIILKCKGFPVAEQMPVGIQVSEEDRKQICEFKPAKSQGFSSLYLKTISGSGIQNLILGLKVKRDLLYLLISDKKAKACMQQAQTELGLPDVGLLVLHFVRARDRFIWPGSEEWFEVLNTLKRGGHAV